MEALEHDGYAIVRGAFTPERLLRLRDELQSALNSGQLLTVLRNPAAPGPGKTLTEEELARGEAYIAQHANHAAIRDPLVTCPAAVPHVYSETVIDMAAGYLGCPPALSGLNLRKSFVNDLPESETNLFHCDGNSPMFIKFFLYLNDVDEPGGPFCYIAGSHRRKPLAWRRKYHWSAKEIEAYYGNGAVRTLTGRVGDLLVADTRGFHRGFKVRSRPRFMLTINYGLHPDFWSDQPVARLPASCLEAFTAKQRAASDFVALV